MRKKTFNHIVDRLFWYIIYLLPIITFIICLFSTKTVTGDSEFNYVQVLDVDSAISQTFDYLIPIGWENVVSQALATFGEYFNIGTMFSAGSFLNGFFTYYVFVVTFHIVVDVVLFVPKLAHKWIGGLIDED